MLSEKYDMVTETLYIWFFNLMLIYENQCQREIQNYVGKHREDIQYENFLQEVSSLRHPWRGASTSEPLQLQLSVPVSLLSLEEGLESSDHLRWVLAGLCCESGSKKTSTFCPLLWAFFFLLIYSSIISSSTVFPLTSTYRSCTPSVLFFVIVKETKNSSPSRVGVALIQSPFKVQEHYQMLLPDAQWNINEKVPFFVQYSPPMESKASRFQTRWVRVSHRNNWERIQVELEVSPHSGWHHGLQVPLLHVPKAVAIGLVHCS